ncbi:MAG TPA: SAM-dependent methyltransferase, partial [Candidatus Sericytochromatia bacterium]
MFYQKAIQAWRDGSEASRVELVKNYFQSVPGFSTPEVIVCKSNTPNFLQWLGAPGGDPFYGVISYRQD